MATIQVELNEKDVRDACMAWAVTRVMNCGQAIACELRVTVCAGAPTGTLNSAVVFVETDAMKQDRPSYIKAIEATR